MYSKPEIVIEIGKFARGSKERIVVVVGGGKSARLLVSLGKLLGLKDRDLHEIGISATLMNALLVSKAIGGTFYKGDPRKLPHKKLLVIGGFKPGWTTDVCAAYACVSSGANVLFNLSKERGVYDKDPEKFTSAKLLNKLSFKRLYTLTRGGRRPGMNYIFDPLAARICVSSDIKVIVTNRFRDVSVYLSGRSVNGSLIA